MRGFTVYLNDLTKKQETVNSLLELCSIPTGGSGEGEGYIQVISVTFLTCLLRSTSATSRHASIITCLS